MLFGIAMSRFAPDSIDISPEETSPGLAFSRDCNEGPRRDLLSMVAVLDTMSRKHREKLTLELHLACLHRQTMSTDCRVWQREVSVNDGGIPVSLSYRVKHTLGLMPFDHTQAGGRERSLKENGEDADHFAGSPILRHAHQLSFSQVFQQEVVGNFGVMGIPPPLPPPLPPAARCISQSPRGWKAPGCSRR